MTGWALCSLWLGMGAVALLSCGYRFTAGGAPLPEGVHAVFVPVFTNRSAEPTLEVPFTEAMREELGRAGVEGGPDAEARLEGEIRSLGAGTGIDVKRYSPKPPDVPVYRLSVAVHLRLKKGARVLAEFDVTGSEDLLSAQGDVLTTESNRGAALTRLAKTLARDAYARLASGF